MMSTGKVNRIESRRGPFFFYLLFIENKETKNPFHIPALCMNFMASIGANQITAM